MVLTDQIKVKIKDQIINQRLDSVMNCPRDFASGEYSYPNLSTLTDDELVEEYKDCGFYMEDLEITAE